MAITNNDKLTGNPYSNVGDWVYSRDIITHPDPLRKHKKKTVKKNKIHTGNTKILFDSLSVIECHKHIIFRFSIYIGILKILSTVYSNSSTFEDLKKF